MHVVLFEPEIPQNTGNIIRLCANTGCKLVLIKPLGFEVTAKHLRRAGLDYHQHVITEVCEDWDDFITRCQPKRLWAMTTKASRWHTDCAFVEDDYLVFGPETRGLPGAMVQDCIAANQALRIPMQADSRSMNLANSVGVVVYEALRQQDFPGCV